MSSRPRHPHKDIEEAVAHLEECGWVWKKTGKSSHAWGRMLCPQNDTTGCQVSVWTTPRNAQSHAKQLMAHGNKCSHVKKEAGDEDI